MKLSIIIPVYNEEKYLSECLDSLLDQNFPKDEYEIICINDGSKDKSEEVILQYKEKHSNIVYLYQENQGVSVARNLGLDAAKGEYVFFVDADDTLYANVLNEIFTRVKSDNLDLLYLKIEYFNKMHQKTGEFKMDSDKVEILDGFNHQRRGYIFGIYRSKILTNIRFKEGIVIGEDALFNLMVHSIAKRCSYFPSPSYKYYYRNNTSTNPKIYTSEKTFNGFLKNISTLKQFIDSNKGNFDNEQLKYFDRPFYKIIEMSLNSGVIPLLSFKRLTKLKKHIKDNDLDYLTSIVNAHVPMFKYNNFVFIAYYTLKRIKKEILKIFKND